MDVSVIIVNYKTPELCINAINPVFEKSVGVAYEIIVVDNASGDNSVEKISNVFGDRVKYIESDVNLGFGKANNLGIKQSTGEFVFLLNSDTLLRNNAIKILCDFLKSDETRGIAGGNLFNASGKPAHSYLREIPSVKNIKLPCLFTRLFRKLTFGKNNREFNATGKPMRINGYITGADMMIRRSALEKSGLFDPDFFMYSEEVELTYRIVKCGYSVWSVPSAEITHLEGGSFVDKRVNEQRERNMISGTCLLFEKIYGPDSVGRLLEVLKHNSGKRMRHYIATGAFGAIKRAKLIRTIVDEYADAYKKGILLYRRQQGCER